MSCKREWSCNNHFKLSADMISFEIHRRTISTSSVERMSKQRDGLDWPTFSLVICDIFLILVLLCTNPSVNHASHTFLYLTLDFLYQSLVVKKEWTLRDKLRTYLFIYSMYLFLFIFHIYFFIHLSQSNIS